MVKTSLAQIPSDARKWHFENCPSSCWLSKRSFGSITTSLCQRRFWEPMEVTTVADKFWYMLTCTGATCLKLCRADNLKVRPLHQSTYWYFFRAKTAQWGVSSESGKTSQKLVPSAFASCTLPFTAKRIEVRVLFLAILCDLFVILQWPCSRSSDLQLEDSKPTLHRLVYHYISIISVCFRAWLLAVCVLVKVSQGSQNLGGLAFWATTVYYVTSLCQLFQHWQAGLSSWTACSRASPKTDSRNLSLVSIVSDNIEHWQTEFYPKWWKHRWPKYLRMLANGILKTVLHHADCPSAHLAVPPLLCVWEDFGSQWR